MKTTSNLSFALTNVRVFDGNGLTEPTTVFVENGLIADETSSNTTIDGRGLTLLPGLIDSHIHLDDIQNLKDAVRYGVTTMLDMTTSSVELVNSLRNQPGLTDVKSCYGAAVSGGGMLASVVGDMSNGVVSTLEEAACFVEGEIAKGAEYIKLILEDQPLTGGMLSPEIIDVVVKTTHRHGKLVYAHTTSVEAYRKAIAGGVDVLNHIPSNEVLPDDVVRSIVDKGIYVIPTVIMEEGLAASIQKMFPERIANYAVVEESLRKLHQAGAILVAGTDANHTNQMCFLQHGSTMHKEMEYMVNAGMSPLEVLRSATCLPATLFGFIGDRGSIEPGKRADFLLVEGDPTKDITATRNIRGVWIKGIKVNEE